MGSLGVGARDVRTAANATGGNETHEHNYSAVRIALPDT
jgi:hypothetical protein